APVLPLRAVRAVPVPALPAPRHAPRHPQGAVVVALARQEPPLSDGVARAARQLGPHRRPPVRACRRERPRAHAVPMRRRRKGIHLLEVGLVWPPETFVQWKLERLASRGFSVTVAGRPSKGEWRARLPGIRLRRQPHWEQSQLQILWGIL